MVKANPEGKRHRRSWLGYQSKRLMSVLLCSSMLSTSVANTTAFAAAALAGGKERKEISFEKESLRQAMREAAKKGKTLREGAYEFSGDEAEAYEALFAGGDLYELHPEETGGGGSLRWNVYARLEPEEDMEHYTISGNEELLFLLTNTSSREQAGRISVNGKVSETIRVAPLQEVKKQWEVEEEVPAKAQEIVGEPGESAEKAEVDDSGKAERESQADSLTETPQKEEEAVTDAEDEEEKDVANPEMGEGVEAGDDLQNPEKAEEPGEKETGREPEASNTSSDAETADTSREEEEKQDNPKENPGKESEKDSAAPGTDSEGGKEAEEAEPSQKEEPGKEESGKEDSGSAPEAEDSHEKAEPDAGAENGKEEDKDSLQVSRSGHFSMFLTSASLATPSNISTAAEEKSGSGAQSWEEEDKEGTERILGDVYGTVGIQHGSAAVFVTSAMELGLTEVAALSAGEMEEIPRWQISKSKKATNLDENFESQVTLSLPSAEELLANDVVFVLDKSTSAELEKEALEMLQELRAQEKENGASVRVGIVIFNQEAHTTGFLDLETQYSEIEAAVKQEIHSGTNLSAGILAGKKMLDEDTAVEADRKSLIVLSDGITYLFGEEEPTAVAWGFQNDGVKLAWAGPDNWLLKYGDNKALSAEEWNGRLGLIQAQLEEQGDGYDYPYHSGGPEEGNAVTPAKDSSQYANSVDKALYLSYEAYLEAAKEQYHCYAMPIGSEAGNNYQWGPSFVKFLANGKKVTFTDIKNDILYAVDQGSTVEDYIGWKEGDYNFDLKSVDQLTVGGTELSRFEDGNTVYFGNEGVDASQYRFKVEYDPEDKEEGEHFVWTMNEAVKNSEPVQLTYTVKLVNPKSNPGETYGQYDEDGSEEYDGLYTNRKAILYPISRSHQEGEPEAFGKPTVSYTVPGGELPTIPEGGTSKSKTAEPLDGDFRSKVTLSLPSAETALVSDVVLVLDKSTSTELEEQALEMLRNLQKEVQEKGAKVKVGVVIFNKEAHSSGFLDLETEYGEIERAIRQEIKSGTNLHAGILAGKAMLDQDISVESKRKTLVVVSDGITYMFNEEPTAVAWGFESDGAKLSWAGPDNWMLKYGNNQAPADWRNWLLGIGSAILTQGDAHDYPYGTEPDVSQITPTEESGNYVNSIDKALYLSYEAYTLAAREGYHCYAMQASPMGDASTYEWGQSFMRYLSNGVSVSFENIEKDILYAVDKGSVVQDYIGYADGDYDFDFDGVDQLAVGGVALPMKQDGDTWYFGDGELNEQNYRFKVVYEAGDKAGTEMFTWYIEEPVSNFAPVQLTYTVKLVNPKTKDGTYGNYDRDGSLHYDGLYTNQEAILYPVDSRGTSYQPEEFPKPTVSYVVEHGTPAPDPKPTPDPDPTPEPEPTPEPTPTPTPEPTPTPNHGGGSSGGHGGRSSSGSRTGSRSSTTPVAMQPTEPVPPAIPEPQPEIVEPTEGLPKTGESEPMGAPMALLAFGMMAAAYVFYTGRRKTEE